MIKKIFKAVCLILLITSISACFSMEPRKSGAIDMILNMEKLLIPEKITQFEVEELLGEPMAKIEKESGSAISYLDGNFYLKNTKEKQEILKPYIPSYFLEDETRFKGTIMMIRFEYNKIKSDYMLDSIYFY